MSNGWSNPPGGSPAPPLKKKTSTFAIVLAFLGAGALLVMLVIGIGIYSVMSSEKGRAIVGMVGEGVKISAKAQKAPGTKELRARGCTQAMVMDMADLQRLLSFVDAGAPGGTGSDSFGEMVVCNVGKNPLPCDSVASTYVGVVGSRPKSFVVTVQQSGHRGPVCSNLYDGQANLLKAMSSNNVAPSLPDGPEE